VFGKLNTGLQARLFLQVQEKEGVSLNLVESMLPRLWLDARASLEALPLPSQGCRERSSPLPPAP